MAAVDTITEAGGESPPATVPVWDRFVRVFHWSIVGLFFLAYGTGDDIEWLHLAAGYAIVGLVGLRVAWGFVGPRHARFSDFVRGPRTVRAHLAEMLRLKSRRHVGHNPAGGAMVVALLVMLSAIALTGHLMTTDALWGSKWVEEAHEALVHATVGLIGLHVLGVLFASIEHGENLIRAMISGKKRAQ